MKSINSALVAIRRSPYQSLLCIFVITITFFVAYCFSLLSLGSARILSFFETRPQVIAFMKLTATDEATQSLANQMRSKDYIKDVKVVSKKDALKIYQAEYKDDPQLLELVTEDILPASVEVSAKDAQDLEQAKTDLQQNTEVDEVTFQEDVVTNLVRWTGAIRSIGVLVLTILLITSFLMIMVVISMKISSKRGQIKIMKFVGANNSYISAPYIWEAIINSSLANIFAFALYYGLLLYITPWLKGFLDGIIAFPMPWQIFAYQFAGGVIFAMVLGILASLVALKRMLRK